MHFAGFLAIIVFFGAIIVGGWLVITVARELLRFIHSVYRKLIGDAADRRGPRTHAWHCADPRCGHVNRATARFCARCGRRLDATAIGNGEHG